MGRLQQLDVVPARVYREDGGSGLEADKVQQLGFIEYEADSLIKSRSLANAWYWRHFKHQEPED